MQNDQDRTARRPQCPELSSCDRCTDPAREFCGYDEHLAEGALVEIEIERRASLAFHFPVSHGPNAATLSAEWDAEDRRTR